MEVVRKTHELGEKKSFKLIGNKIYDISKQLELVENSCIGLVGDFGERIRRFRKIFTGDMKMISKPELLKPILQKAIAALRWTTTRLVEGVFSVDAMEPLQKVLAECTKKSPGSGAPRKFVTSIPGLGTRTVVPHISDIGRFLSSFSK